jgi:hypothetical protein
VSLPEAANLPAYVAVLGAGIGVISSAFGIIIAGFAARAAIRYRTARESAMKELAQAQVSAVLDLRNTLETRQATSHELAQVEGVLSAGSRLA